MKLTVSKRAQRTETAVIDDLLELYGGLPGIVNLAPGSPAITPSAAVRDAAAEAARDPAVSMYGDVLGYAPLRACWMQRVLADWEPWTLREEAAKAGACKEEDYGLELMVTAGANQVCWGVCVCGAAG
jgi:aspartate/methionine/tyrosine aminotransferase